MEKIFKNFTDKAMAAASIGQVHKATLLDGTDVVVKVQYPEVEQYFEADMLCVKLMCKMCGMGDTIKMIDEFSKSFEDEFDYRGESGNMRICADNMKQFPQVYIPAPVDKEHPSSTKDYFPGGLCTRKVLVMERVIGLPIKKKMNNCLAALAAEQGKTVKQLTDEYEETFKDPVKMKEFMEQAPPSEFATSCGLYYLLSRDIVRNAFAQTYNYTIGLGGILGAPIDVKWTPSSVNGPAVTKLLY